MERTNEVNRQIKKWQIKLDLEDWVLGVRFVDFKRKDYQQSGDIEVDSKNKKATILISNNPKYGDERIVVHELAHLLLWEYDHFCENQIPKNKKGQYFDLLEEAAAKLTKILLRRNK